MNSATTILIIVTALYLLFYQTKYWLYFLAVLIPYTLITQVILCDFKTNTSKRKFYISSWTHPFDSQIYTNAKFDITEVKKFLKKYNEEKGVKIGLTIFLMKLLGNLFVKYPSINGNILFGRFFKKKHTDISCMVQTNNGRGTEIITIKNTEQLSLETISDTIKERLENILSGLDMNYNRKFFFLYLLPSFILAPFLSIVSYMSAIGFNVSWLGLPSYWYGTATVVNYGKIGMVNTYLPICRNFLFIT